MGAAFQEFKHLVSTGGRRRGLKKQQKWEKKECAYIQLGDKLCILNKALWAARGGMGWERMGVTECSWGWMEEAK